MLAGERRVLPQTRQRSDTPAIRCPPERIASDVTPILAAPRGLSRNTSLCTLTILRGAEIEPLGQVAKILQIPGVPATCGAVPVTGDALVVSSQMKATMDAVGRVVVPKPLRDALGLSAGSTVDISRYGAGLQLLPTGRTALVVEEAGVLVATGETTIDDDDVFALIDSGRR